MGIAERAGRALNAWEGFLRLDRLTRTGDLIRARLIYSVCLFFIALQMMNQIALTNIYNGFSSQHVISILACLALAGIMLLLRRTANKTLFGLIFAFVIIAAFVAGTLESNNPALNGGINSSLLPLLVVGVAMIGWMGNWRVTAAYFVSCLVLLFGMYHMSLSLGANMNYPPAIIEAMVINTNQRMTQALIALTVASAVGIAFGHKFYDVVDELEDNADAARQIEQLKSAFHANMTHEIRSPLNGIIGMSEVLCMTDLDARQAECARIINEAGTSLNRIIDEVLDISKLENGMMQLDMQAFDLTETLQDVVALHQAGASNKSLWLGVDWQVGLPSCVVGDESRLRQVLGNLVGNAVKFTQTGGIRLGVRGQVLPDGTQARIQIFVQDTGPGIAPEDQTRIFERYGQSVEGRRLGSKGTGLGLSIASDIVGLMGGELQLNSRVGNGATFHFVLDMRLANDKALASQPPALGSAA